METRGTGLSRQVGLYSTIDSWENAHFHAVLDSSSIRYPSVDKESVRLRKPDEGQNEVLSQLHPRPDMFRHQGGQRRFHADQH